MLGGCSSLTTAFCSSARKNPVRAGFFSSGRLANCLQFFCKHVGEQADSLLADFIDRRYDHIEYLQMIVFWTAKLWLSPYDEEKAVAFFMASNQMSTEAYRAPDDL